MLLVGLLSAEWATSGRTRGNRWIEVDFSLRNRPPWPQTATKLQATAGVVALYIVAAVLSASLMWPPHHAAEHIEAAGFVNEEEEEL